MGTFTTDVEYTEFTKVFYVFLVDLDSHIFQLINSIDIPPYRPINSVVYKVNTTDLNIV